MSEEKQKIISDICPFYKEYGTCDQCNSALDIDDEPCYFECMANAIINNGYRKQSVGEWIDRYNNDFANPIYMCSICGKGTLLKPHIDELNNMEMTQALSPYCPNCGAKMKGGAE